MTNIIDGINDGINKTMLSRYEQAHTLMKGERTNEIVRNDTVFPYWVSCVDKSDSHSLWYIRETIEGKEYRLVDIKSASNALAFDHNFLANELNNVLAEEFSRTGSRSFDDIIDPKKLPLKGVKMIMVKRGAPLEIHFQALGKHWCFKSDTSGLEEIVASRNGDISPDGKKIAFVREHNIWVQDLFNGEEWALTSDGTEDCKYGSSLYVGPDTLLWSADSQSLLFTQLDTKKVRSVPHVNYVPTDGSLHPQFTEKTLSYPGDEHIPNLQLIVVNVGTGQLQKSDYPPITYMVCGVAGMGLFDSGLGWWSADSQSVFFY